jgi:hypothetical protein
MEVPLLKKNFPVRQLGTKLSFTFGRTKPIVPSVPATTVIAVAATSVFLNVEKELQLQESCDRQHWQ